VFEQQSLQRTLAMSVKSLKTDPPGGAITLALCPSFMACSTRSGTGTRLLWILAPVIGIKPQITLLPANGIPATWRLR
jgi:hypothetical protein